MGGKEVVPIYITLHDASVSVSKKKRETEVGDFERKAEKGESRSFLLLNKSTEPQHPERDPNDPTWRKRRGGAWKRHLECVGGHGFSQIE